MIETIQTELNQGVRKMAENSLIKKLDAQGINRSDLTNEKLWLDLYAYQLERIESVSIPI